MAKPKALDAKITSNSSSKVLYHIEDLLSERNTGDIHKEIMCSGEWKDGILTANYGGEIIKKNLQLNSVLAPKAKNTIEYQILNNAAICNRCFTKKIHAMFFSRTGDGMFYGAHTDKPNINSGRRDISFTIFLNDPEQYDGGELILYINPEVKSVRLNPGQAIFYPTKYLHEVKPVTAGERIVCVGWIESDIEEHEEREILTNLQQSINSLLRHDHMAANTLLQTYNILYKKFMH